MQPQFNIEGFEITDNQITVNTEKYSIIIPVVIPLDKFEWWLRMNDKLEWNMNLGGDVVEAFFGKMSLPEYWAIEPEHIKQDLYQYISTNSIITKEGDFFSTGVDSLVLAFDKHNAARSNPVFNTCWEHEQLLFTQCFN